MSGRGEILIPDETKLVSVAEMQAIERSADEQGHSYASMMEIAGSAVADQVAARIEGMDAFVLVLVGPGNNGGDGLVCARHLHQKNIKVVAYLWKRSTDPENDYENHFAHLAALGVESATANEDREWVVLHSWLKQATVVIDGLLGTGANRPIEGELASLLTCVKQTCERDDAPCLVAIDSPSGLNCDNGVVDPYTVAADLTVTFAYAKHGHFIFPAPAVTGTLVTADIGTAPELAKDVRAFLLTEPVVRSWLPARSVYSHKGTFGKVMLAVGSVNYPGAAFLACAAAARVGAGLVTGAIPEPVWAPTAAKISEPTWLPLPVGGGEAGGAIAEEASSVVAETLPGYNALVLGCGLGQRMATQHFVQRLLSEADLPATVIDADGLNCLAQHKQWASLLPAQTILTPHPAEMARLCNRSVREIVADRWGFARRMAKAWSAVVLLKGPYTVIADPDGTLAVLPIATAALATAGTGDVLAGSIGGLLAQGVPSFQAACLGSWLHGRAGEACAVEIGVAGALASDLLSRLPLVLSQMR